ncbi:MAG: pseudouridine synthase [Saprospiraceae bacterium]
MAEFIYYAVYKPYGVISQFTPETPGDATLASLHSFPSDVYPVGRLDQDSEGLLILTNDTSVNSQMLGPSSKKNKTYLAQLEGIISQEALDHIGAGITINVNGESYFTHPCEIVLIDAPNNIPERYPPVRYRANKPTSWIKITLAEGKNRQIRKMCAATGYPVLRLIRISFGKYALTKLLPGSVTQIKKKDLL